MQQQTSGAKPRRPRPGEVEFTDSANRAWVVQETVCRVTLAAPRPCLIFECRVVVRRIYSYPANWRELDAAGLERLSNGR